MGLNVREGKDSGAQRVGGQSSEEAAFKCKRRRKAPDCQAQRKSGGRVQEILKTPQEEAAARGPTKPAGCGQQPTDPTGQLSVC